MPSSQRRTKRSPKLNQILTTVRREIVGGNYGPGDRLPPRAHWESRFGVSWATVQKAFNILSREGFVRTSGRSGTYVAEWPPHLNRFALLFRHTSNAGTRWARFCDQLLTEVTSLHVRSHVRVVPYQGIDGHADVEDYRRLTADIQSGRLAGLIFTSPPGEEFFGTPILDDPRIARIQIEGRRAAEIPVVRIDWPAFFDKAAQYFAVRGRKRIALVSYRGFFDDHRADFHNALQRHGLETRDHWIQEPDWTYPSGIRRCVNLLVRGNGAERPDALIVNDDNQLESAAEGIRDAQINVPQDLEVVAFSDLPYLVSACVPIHHIGFRVESLLNTCVEQLSRQIRGNPSPPELIIPIEETGFTGLPRQSCGPQTAPDVLHSSSELHFSIVGHRTDHLTSF